MAARTPDLWGWLSLLALVVIVGLLLRGVFRSTGKRQIRRSLRQDDYDPLGSGGIGLGGGHGSSGGEVAGDSGATD